MPTTFKTTRICSPGLASIVVTENFIAGTVPTKVDDTKVPLDVDASSGMLWAEGSAGNVDAVVTPYSIVLLAKRRNPDLDFVNAALSNEDTAVAVEDLPAYIADFDRLLAEKYGIDCIHYAHAGAGEQQADHGRHDRTHQKATHVIGCSSFTVDPS